MMDDSELQMSDDSLDGRANSPKRRRPESDGNRLAPALAIALLVLLFAGGIYYFITKRPSEESATVQSKMATLEERIMGLEKQIAELQGKSAGGTPDLSLLPRLETLSQRVDTLEKRSKPAIESKAKSSPKSQAEGQKRYHKVQKGETLSKISKKCGIPVDELRKLNHLSHGEPVRAGQKLLISAGP